MYQMASLKLKNRSTTSYEIPHSYLISQMELAFKSFKNSDLLSYSDSVNILDILYISMKLYSKTSLRVHDKIKKIHNIKVNSHVYNSTLPT